MFELQHLRQFVAVAECENIGRAAEVLHISPSPLSRRILQLESGLGLALFARSKKRLRLTAAGRAFLEEAKGLLAHATRVEQRARGAAAGAAGTLVVGFVDGAVHTGVLPNALAAFQRDAPGVRIELRSLRSAAQCAALRRGELDAAFTYAPPDEGDGLRATRLVEEPFRLAVPSNHPFARRQWRPAELAREAFIALPESVSMAARRELVAACGRLGFVPDVRCEAAEPATVLTLVASGMGVAVVQASLAARAPAGVKLLKLPEAFPLRARIFCVMPVMPTPLAARFGAVIAHTFKTRRAAPST